MPFQITQLRSSSSRRAYQYIQGVDWSRQPAIVGGAKVSSFTVDILLNGSTSTDLTASNLVVNAAGYITQFALTDVAAAKPNVYEVRVHPTLDDGEKLPPESLYYEIIDP